jgi:hopanoid biosynthesis associated radical SAM protein HpnH
MSIPLIQQASVARYVITQRLRSRDKYPLVLMLEPLFRCNLNCIGCGKIAYSEEVLDRRLSVEECLAASEECGAPVVSVTGGEPLLHREMPRIVEGLVKRKKFVYLCTNGLLLKSHIQDYSPSAYLTFSIHLDGSRERHDFMANRHGVFDSAVETIRLVRQRGFRVTVNCTLSDGVTLEEGRQFFDFVMGLGVEGITLSPGFSYAQAPRKDIFLKRQKSFELFRGIFRLARKRSWKFNQSALFLDFLAGNQEYRCTPWGNPTRNVFGWQRPCYLLMGEGYASTFKSLLEETEWHRYGRGRNTRCEDCMLHSGFEATAVNDALSDPLKALWVKIRGPRTEGPTAWEDKSLCKDSSLPHPANEKGGP